MLVVRSQPPASKLADPITDPLAPITNIEVR
jgi:hypothetical protein